MIQKQILHCKPVFTGFAETCKQVFTEKFLKKSSLPLLFRSCFKGEITVTSIP